MLPDVALGALVEMARQNQRSTARAGNCEVGAENFQEKEEHQPKRALMQLVDELYAQQTPMTLIGRDGSYGGVYPQENLRGAEKAHRIARILD